MSTSSAPTPIASSANPGCEAGPLGVVAGRGALPRRLIAAAAAQGRASFVLGFHGYTDAETLAAAPSALVRLGAIGEAFAVLRAAGVRELAMAGKIERPSLTALRPDAKGMALLARIGARALGDDGLLRAVTAEIEREGFRVLPVSAIAPGSLAQVGVWSRRRPTEADAIDIARGFDVAGALGAVDVGQSVVVQQGVVLGVEAAEGTDALIQRCGALKLEGPGGVLVKRCKPGQDRRLDLPAIGVATFEAVAAAGLGGVAVEAERTLVIEPEAVRAAADRLGLFWVGVDPA